MDSLVIFLFSLLGLGAGGFLTSQAERLGVEAWRDSVVIEQKAITVDPAHPRAETNGALVHFVGIPETDDTLVLPQTDFSAIGALRLQQSVEMYQWVERRRSNDDGASEYWYELRWARDRVPSERFRRSRYRNPPIPWTTEAVSAAEVDLGSFGLKRDALAKMDWFESVDVCRTMWQPGADFRCEEGYIYFGTGSLSAPYLGDVRMTIDIIPPDVMSFVGRQLGSGARAELRPFPLFDGDTLLEVREGPQTIPQMAALRRDQDFWSRLGLSAGGAFVSGIGSIFVGAAVNHGVYPGVSLARVAAPAGVLTYGVASASQWFGYDDGYAMALILAAGFAAAALMIFLP